jgi:hypothetical protein
MLKRPLISLAAAAALLGVAKAVLAHEGHGEIPPPQVVFDTHSQSVPFTLFRGNRIILQARINGHVTDVVLDTGASATTLDRAYARSIGLPAGTKIQGKGTGGIVEAELVSGLTLEVGGMRLEKLNVGVMDLAPVARSIGRPVTAILGREFFNSAVVSIDWAAGRLRVSSPQAFRPDAEATAVPLTRKGRLRTIPVSIAGKPAIDALLDLGNGGALSLPRTYWASQPELSGLRFAEARAGGVGGLHATRQVLIPRVTLASETFADVPAQLSEGGNDEDPTQMANVGIGLLKQFKVDLDLGRDRIYLTPRRDGPSFERDRAGVRFDLLGDRLEAVFVSPQAPAARAGLKAGDELVSVDGVRIGPDYYQRDDWTRGPAGRTVLLERADGSTLKVTLDDYF